MIRIVKFLLIGLVTLTFAGCSSMPWHKPKQPAAKPAATKQAVKKPKPAAKVAATADAAAQEAASSAEPPAPVMGTETTPADQSGAADTTSSTQMGTPLESATPVPPPAPKVMPGPASHLPSNQRLLNMSFPVAWSKVGTALQASGYRIMQHDRTMGAIFVIDVKANAGVIKPDTPIYQVKLTAEGNQTKLTVLTSGGGAAGPRVTVPLFSALTQKGV